MNRSSLLDAVSADETARLDLVSGRFRKRRPKGTGRTSAPPRRGGRKPAR